MERMTIKQIAIVTGYLMRRDHLEQLQVNLPDEERRLFLPSSPSSEQIQGSALFSKTEIHSLRSRLYPQPDVTARPKPNPQTIDEIRRRKNMVNVNLPTPQKATAARIHPHQLTVTQKDKLIKLDVDLELAEITEKYIGGSRPQHQHIVVTTPDITYVLSRRGKITDHY